MHNPTLIPVLLKDSSIPNGMVYRELNKALPCRIGIEFELAGNFSEGFNADHPEFMGKHMNETLTKFYKVREINSDYVSQDVEDIKEIRVSIDNFRQLTGLYNFMQDLPKYCRIHEGGGIHIHVDMTEFDFLHCKQRKVVKNYITNRLNEIGKIFPKYKGKYNKKAVGDVAKATWVNMSRLGTLEFRTAPLTFDYNTLMTWLVKLMKFRRILIHDCRLKTVKSNKWKVKHALESITADDLCEEFEIRLDNDTGHTIISNSGGTIAVPIDTSASYTAYTTNGTISYNTPFM